MDATTPIFGKKRLAKALLSWRKNGRQTADEKSTKPSRSPIACWEIWAVIRVDNLIARSPLPLLAQNLLNCVKGWFFLEICIEKKGSFWLRVWVISIEPINPGVLV